MENPKKEPVTIFIQTYEGIVTSSGKEKVIIEFKTDDDLEERCFNPAELSTPRPLEEGQAVQARCYLDLVPPRGPLSEEEIKKFREQYKDFSNYLDKSEKSKNILL